MAISWNMEENVSLFSLLLITSQSYRTHDVYEMRLILISLSVYLFVDMWFPICIEAMKCLVHFWICITMVERKFKNLQGNGLLLKYSWRTTNLHSIEKNSRTVIDNSSWLDVIRFSETYIMNRKPKSYRSIRPYAYHHLLLNENHVAYKKPFYVPTKTHQMWVTLNQSHSMLVPNEHHVVLVQSWNLRDTHLPVLACCSIIALFEKNTPIKINGSGMPFAMAISCASMCGKWLIILSLWPCHTADTKGFFIHD